jgi:predicted heme/steroid binding protein
LPPPPPPAAVLPPPAFLPTAFCSGSVQLATSGTISDGSGSAPYRDGMNCAWLISGSQISLRFTSLDLESGYDFVKVYSGRSASGSALAILTGQNVPSTPYIAFGGMYIQFTSDSSVSAGGFQAEYSTGAAPPAPVATALPTGTPRTPPTGTPWTAPTGTPFTYVPTNYPSSAPSAAPSASPSAAQTGVGARCSTLSRLTAASGVISDGPGAYSSGSYCE